MSAQSGPIGYLYQQQVELNRGLKKRIEELERI